MPNYKSIKKGSTGARRRTSSQSIETPHSLSNDTCESEVNDSAYQEGTGKVGDSVENPAACLLPRNEASSGTSPSLSYVFTHELPREALTQNVGQHKVLLAGSLTGVGKSPENDVRKSHINPIFTRVLSIGKGGSMKGVTRSAYTPNLVGGQQPIVMLIAPSAATSEHQAVDSYIEQQNREKKAGWPKYPPINKSVKTGLYRSYNKDVGKVSGTSIDELSPTKLATSERYKYTNEQHWHRGIALEDHLRAVVLKVRLGEDGKYGLVKSGQTQQAGDAKVWGLGELLGLPSKASDKIVVDDEVKRTVDWSTTITTYVYAVTPNYPLENIIHILNEIYGGTRFENLPSALTQPDVLPPAPLAAKTKKV